MPGTASEGEAPIDKKGRPREDLPPLAVKGVQVRKAKVRHEAD
jgi:hypothetical protein